MRSCFRSHSPPGASPRARLARTTSPASRTFIPDGGFTSQTGSISGRVTKNGAGLFGAHIVAFNLATGALVAAILADESRGSSQSAVYARAAYHPGRTARRRGHQRVFRRDHAGRSQFPCPLLRSARRCAARPRQRNGRGQGCAEIVWQDAWQSSRSLLRRRPARLHRPATARSMCPGLRDQRRHRMDGWRLVGTVNANEVVASGGAFRCSR